MWSTTGACIGKIRSTPCPKLTLRTVMVSPMPVLWRATTVPSKACRRSLSPSLILTCTRMVSPGRNAGRSVRWFLFAILVMTAFCIISSLLSQFFRVQQIGAKARGFFPRRICPPFPDLLVVPTQQHFRRFPAAKFRRPGVLRPVEQTSFAERLGEGFIYGRGLVPQHAFLQASHRVHHHRRRQLTAAQHVIANRDLLVGQVFRDALIDSFVTATNQQQLTTGAVFPRPRLVELSSLGRQQDHFPALAPLGPDRFHRFKDRSGLQQHAFASAEGPVIHGPVPVAGPAPQIVHLDLDQPGFPRPLHHAVLERPPEKLRKNRQHMKLHDNVVFMGAAISWQRPTTGRGPVPHRPALFTEDPATLRATPPEWSWPPRRSPGRSNARTGLEFHGRPPPPRATEADRRIPLLPSPLPLARPFRLSPSGNPPDPRTSTLLLPAGRAHRRAPGSRRPATARHRTSN